MRSAVALVAVAMGSACGGGSVTAPSTDALNVRYVGRTLTVNGRPVTAARLNPLPRYATLVPDRRRHKTDYEYVFNDYGSYATIFDYPKSDQQIGEIAGDGGQGCTNKLHGYGKKIFWNVGGQSQITEYAVPQTPIKTISVPYDFPSSCAMDKTGDLAVGILYASGAGGGYVVVFKNASGSGTAYPTPLDEEFFDGYDPNGDLFADGFTGDRSGFALVELPKGASKFVTITTSNNVEFPGSVQWDGAYLAVTDQIANEVYRYSISGTNAMLKGTVPLSGSSDCAQTWIITSLMYCADAGNEGAEVFAYPAGGSPVAILSGDFDFPLGVTAAKN
jgi:hypothetical protein